MNKKTKHLKFSLVELFIVVALLFLLISLLSPSLKKIYSKAEALECTNNFKTIGVANNSYLDDFAGQFINVKFGYAEVSYFLGRGLTPINNPTGRWSWSLNIGYKSIYNELYLDNWDTFLCPTIREKYKDIAAASTWNPTVTLARIRTGAAKMNHYIFTNGVENTYGIASPSQAIFSMDSQSAMKNRDGNLNFGRFAFRLGHKMYQIMMRHDYRSSALFLDGHVESIEDVDLFNNPQYLAVDPNNVNAFKRQSEWRDLSGFTYEE